MAACYHCARKGADFRRNVVTGQSTGVYYGKRSTSSSTRVNTGLRTLCEECAFFVDRGQLVQDIVVLWILVIVLVGLIIHFKF